MWKVLETISKNTGHSTVGYSVTEFKSHLGPKGYRLSIDFNDQKSAELFASHLKFKSKKMVVFSDFVLEESVKQVTESQKDNKTKYSIGLADFEFDAYVQDVLKINNVDFRTALQLNNLKLEVKYESRSAELGPRPSLQEKLAMSSYYIDLTPNEIVRAVREKNTDQSAKDIAKEIIAWHLGRFCQNPQGIVEPHVQLSVARILEAVEDVTGKKVELRQSEIEDIQVEKIDSITYSQNLVVEQVHDLNSFVRRIGIQKISSKLDIPDSPPYLHPRTLSPSPVIGIQFEKNKNSVFAFYNLAECGDVSAIREKFFIGLNPKDTYETFKDFVKNPNWGKGDNHSSLGLLRRRHATMERTNGSYAYNEIDVTRDPRLLRGLSIKMDDNTTLQEKLNFQNYAFEIKKESSIDWHIPLYYIDQYNNIKNYTSLSRVGDILQAYHQEETRAWMAKNNHLLLTQCIDDYWDVMIEDENCRRLMPMVIGQLINQYNTPNMNSDKQVLADVIAKLLNKMASEPKLAETNADLFEAFFTGDYADYEGFPEFPEDLLDQVNNDDFYSHLSNPRLSDYISNSIECNRNIALITHIIRIHLSKCHPNHVLAFFLRDKIEAALFLKFMENVQITGPGPVFFSNPYCVKGKRKWQKDHQGQLSLELEDLLILCSKLPIDNFMDFLAEMPLSAMVLHESIAKLSKGKEPGLGFVKFIGGECDADIIQQDNFADTFINHCQEKFKNNEPVQNRESYSVIFYVVAYLLRNNKLSEAQAEQIESIIKDNKCKLDEESEIIINCINGLLDEAKKEYQFEVLNKTEEEDYRNQLLQLDYLPHPKDQTPEQKFEDRCRQYPSRHLITYLGVDTTAIATVEYDINECFNKGYNQKPIKNILKSIYSKIESGQHLRTVTDELKKVYIQLNISYCKKLKDIDSLNPADVAKLFLQVLEMNPSFEQIKEIYDLDPEQIDLDKVLYDAVVANRSLDHIKMICDLGANPARLFGENNSALLLAMREGRDKTVETLCYGKDVADKVFQYNSENRVIISSNENPETKTSNPWIKFQLLTVYGMTRKMQVGAESSIGFLLSENELDLLKMAYKMKGIEGDFAEIIIGELIEQENLDALTAFYQQGLSWVLEDNSPVQLGKQLAGNLHIREIPLPQLDNEAAKVWKLKFTLAFIHKKIKYAEHPDEICYYIKQLQYDDFSFVREKSPAPQIEAWSHILSYAKNRIVALCSKNTDLMAELSSEVEATLKIQRNPNNITEATSFKMFKEIKTGSFSKNRKNDLDKRLRHESSFFSEKLDQAERNDNASFCGKPTFRHTTSK